MTQKNNWYLTTDIFFQWSTVSQHDFHVFSTLGKVTCKWLSRLFQYLTEKVSCVLLLLSPHLASNCSYSRLIWPQIALTLASFGLKCSYSRLIWLQNALTHTSFALKMLLLTPHLASNWSYSRLIWPQIAPSFASFGLKLLLLTPHLASNCSFSRLIWPQIALTHASFGLKLLLLSPHLASNCSYSRLIWPQIALTHASFGLKLLLLSPHLASNTLTHSSFGLELLRHAQRTVPVTATPRPTPNAMRGLEKSMPANPRCYRQEVLRVTAGTGGTGTGGAGAGGAVDRRYRYRIEV